ncbi:hypothetical protein Tco_0994757 [Tanacetum coccineum]
MAESSSHNPSSPGITPKEELVTLDKPESLNPFLPASQVDFSFDEITFTTNNVVALLYPSHPNQDYFETLEDSKVSVSTPTGGVRGDIGITTFRNALRAQYLPHLSMYVPPPSITIVGPWFETIGYSREIGAKGTLKKRYLPPKWKLLMAQIIQCLGGKTGGLDQISNKDATILYCLANGGTSRLLLGFKDIQVLLKLLLLKLKLKVFSVHNWTLKPNQPKEPPFTDHMKAICKLDVPVDSKAPKPYSQTKEGMDEGTKNYSFDHIFAGTNPSVLVDKTKSVGDGLKTAHTDLGANEESRADEISKKIKLEDLSNLLKDTRSAFFTPDSPPDEPIIILDESEEEEEVAKDKDTHATSYDVLEDTSVPPPPSLKSAQIQELIAQVHLLQS